MSSCSITRSQERQIDFFTFNNIKGRSGRMFEHFVGHVYLFNEPPTEQLPFVDFPLFTQGQRTPESLLVQMEDEDLIPASRERMKKYQAQEILPVSVLRENGSIDPDAQIRLASHLAAMRVDMPICCGGQRFRKVPS